MQHVRSPTPASSANSSEGGLANTALPFYDATARQIEDLAGFCMQVKGLVDPGMFFRGLLIGLSVAAPVGPMGVLCIRRTLAEGRLAGLVTGLGIATADGIYAGIAGFGIAVVAALLLSGQGWIRGIGGAFLCYLGLHTARAIPAEGAAEAPSGLTLLRIYGSALALTLANPTTILSFIAIFAGLGAGGRGGDDATLLVVGVLTGSALWWLLLSTGVAALRGRITPRVLRWVNRLFGIVLGLFGLLALASLR